MNTVYKINVHTEIAIKAVSSRYVALLFAVSDIQLPEPAAWPSLGASQEEMNVASLSLQQNAL
jgi:hypothetical protein